MKILDNVNISGSVSMASVNADNFTIGTELENNNISVDNLVVNANANFKNNIILGSSNADTLVINASVSGSIGNITASNLYITGGTIFYNGTDLLSNANPNAGGDNNQQATTNTHNYTVVTSSVFYMDSENLFEIYYSDPSSVNGNIYLYLPDVYNDKVLNKLFYFKQMNNGYFTIIQPINSQTIDGSTAFISIPGPAGEYDAVVLHAMKDPRDNSCKWFRLIYP
jgi:hypothetical protein